MSNLSLAIPAEQCFISTMHFKSKSIPHILVRHEQAATHAADGYARAQVNLCGSCHFRS